MFPDVFPLVLWNSWLGDMKVSNQFLVVSVSNTFIIKSNFQRQSDSEAPLVPQWRRDISPVHFMSLAQFVEEQLNRTPEQLSVTSSWVKLVTNDQFSITKGSSNDL